MVYGKQDSAEDEVVITLTRGEYDELVATLVRAETLVAEARRVELDLSIQRLRLAERMQVSRKVPPTLPPPARRDTTRYIVPEDVADLHKK